MTLLQIIVATLIGGIFSVLLAYVIASTFLDQYVNRMVAFAVGVLLGFALTDILPEAVSMGLNITQAGWMLITGIMGFFLLEKLALWRHDHNAHLNDTKHKPQVTMIVVGDAMHNFVDGILLAAVFLADWRLGWMTALAVTMHEIPHEISNFMVLLNGGLSKSRALLFNALSGFAMTLGGVLGWLSLTSSHAIIPYILTLAAASFIYIAMSDLVPELHHERQPKDILIQIVLIILGVLMPPLCHALQSYFFPPSIIS
jgi:zinc and cadmium transporter